MPGIRSGRGGFDGAEGVFKFSLSLLAPKCFSLLEVLRQGEQDARGQGRACVQERLSPWMRKVAERRERSGGLHFLTESKKSIPDLKEVYEFLA